MLLDDTDEQLLERISADDGVAFRILVERYVDRAYALALRLVGVGSDAEEVTQQAMLDLWAQRDTPSTTQFPVRLYRLIIGQCLSCPIRSDVLAGEAHRLSRFDRAFRELPFQQRAVLMLAHFDHMGVQQIADTLWVSKEEAEHLLQRGRRALRTNQRIF